MWWIPYLFKISMTAMEGVKNQIFKKVNLPTKPTERSYFFLFHSHNLKPKQNHQIASSRMKTRSTRSQTCMNYRGNIICFQRNTYVNTRDLKILYKNCPNEVDFPDVIFNFSKVLCGLPSLIVSSVLWLLSLCNTLSVSHWDTATGHHKELYH